METFIPDLITKDYSIDRHKILTSEVVSAVFDEDAEIIPSSF